MITLNRFVFMVAPICLVISGISSPALAEGVLIQAAGEQGMVVLDEGSGSITFCAAGVNVTVPDGKCAGIGGLPISPAISNGFVTIGGVGGTAAFVGNPATGYVVECALENNSGEPLGSCVPVANPIR